jgi:dimethylamine monooxygenase subunit C
MNDAIFVEGKRKYLFCIDQKGMPKLAPIIEMVIEKNISFELYFIGAEYDKDQVVTDLSKWLSGQKMGSFLYVAVTWDKLKNIKKLSEDIGFSNEEVQFVGYGVKDICVFCCRCHGITELSKQHESSEQTIVNCCHCGLLLEISDHYSTLKDAYLGYVAQL